MEPIPSIYRCRNEIGQGLAHRPVIVGVSRDLRGDSWGCVPRSLFWRKDLDRDGECGFDYLTFALVSSKGHRECVGIRVADSYTGNHPEGGFTPLETIQRLLVVIGRRSHSGFEGEAFELRDEGTTSSPPIEFMSVKDTIAVQHYGLLAKELNEFLSSYPIPSDENKLDSKFFKDKLPQNIDENPYFQRLGRYLTSVRVFDDPILFLAGLKPSWEFGQQQPTISVGGKEMPSRTFIYTEDDDDLSFLPKEPSLGFGIGSPSASVNMEPPKDVEEPELQPAKVTADSGESLKAGVFVVHPGSVAACVKERKCKIKGGSLRPPVKRKLASGSSSSHVVRAKTSASKDDAPFLSISDDDEGKFLAVVDNAVNRRAHEFLQVIEKISGDADNPAILALQEKISSLTADVKEHKDKARLEAIEASLHKEVEELKKDRRDVVSKVIPYAAMELVHRDELGRLVGKLVSSTITYGRCRAYEQVAAMKEPFDLSKAKGYRSSYQKDHTQARYDFATATFPWLDEFVADATNLIETLLLKKPPMLQKPTPSRT
ncbi:hypothetical protein Tco_0809863 [Tanacetum coccineum]